MTCFSSSVVAGTRWRSATNTALHGWKLVSIHPDKMWHCQQPQNPFSCVVCGYTIKHASWLGCDLPRFRNSDCGVRKVCHMQCTISQVLLHVTNMHCMRQQFAQGKAWGQKQLVLCCLPKQQAQQFLQVPGHHPGRRMYASALPVCPTVHSMFDILHGFQLRLQDIQLCLHVLLGVW